MYSRPWFQEGSCVFRASVMAEKNAANKPNKTTTPNCTELINKELRSINDTKYRNRNCSL